MRIGIKLETNKNQIFSKDSEFSYLDETLCF